VPLSFLQVDAPNVVVEAWKAADDGNGTVLRLLETGGKESTTMLRFPMLQLQRAWLCNAMEEDSKELAVENSSVEVALQPHQIITVRVLGQFQRPGP
jgi:alpha-mannosidase